MKKIKNIIKEELKNLQKQLKEAENCGEQYCGRDKNGSHTYCTSHNYPQCDCCNLQVVKDLIDGKSTVGGGKQVKIRTSKTKGDNVMQNRFKTLANIKRKI